MATQILKAVDAKIRELEGQLGALKTARAALAGTGGRRGTSPASAPRGRRRRKFSAAQRAEISRRMKALWAKRKAGKK